jgi:hypothetical protein
MPRQPKRGREARRSPKQSSLEVSSTCRRWRPRRQGPTGPDERNATLHVSYNFRYIHFFKPTLTCDR